MVRGNGAPVRTRVRSPSPSSSSTRVSHVLRGLPSGDVRCTEIADGWIDLQEGDLHRCCTLPFMDFDNLSYAAAGVKRLVVVAPNWLGDAVMALPALADVRRGAAGAVIDVAARPSVAPLFTLADGASK